MKFVERGLFAMEQIDCSAGNGHCQRTARGLGGRVTGPEGPFPHSAEGKGGPGCHFTKMQPFSLQAPRHLGPGYPGIM